jgi:cyanate lyase
MTRPGTTQQDIDREAVRIELWRVLATLNELSLIGEHAHWDIVGPSFRSLHLELDELIDAWRGAADAVRERIAALGGSAEGPAEAVEARSELPTLTEGPQPAPALRLVPQKRAENVGRRSELQMLTEGRQPDRAFVASLTALVTDAVRLIRACTDGIEVLDAVTADLLHWVVASLEDQLVGLVDMDRRDVTAQILAAKRRKGLSFTQIAERVGADRVWLTAALHGQHPLSAEQAAAVTALLDLPAESAAVLEEVPTRGSLDGLPPADPTIYRLYEVLQLYGPALKALIHEDFGDGIMSAVTFNLTLERRETDTGPRVRITLDGKFHPYSPGSAGTAA